MIIPFMHLKFQWTYYEAPLNRWSIAQLPTIAEVTWHNRIYFRTAATSSAIHRHNLSLGSFTHTLVLLRHWWQ